MSYKEAGVDVVGAEQWVSWLKQRAGYGDARVLGGIGGYASLFQINDKQVIAATTDGVGTKLLYAFQRGIHNTVGIDLVAMNVNDIICTGARPLFLLDYISQGVLEPSTREHIIDGIIAGCKMADTFLLGGETAQMNDFYKDGEYDLAAFCVGMVNKDEIVDGQHMRPGDVLIGLDSSGVHSNGYSLIRRHFPSEETHWSDALLAPTRIYTRQVLRMLDDHRRDITGLFHVTGSGYRKLFRLNSHIGFRIDGFPEPTPLFQEVAKRTGLDDAELFQTFNMGIGFVLAIRPDSPLLSQLDKYVHGFCHWHGIGEVTDNVGVVEFPEFQIFRD